MDSAERPSQARSDLHDRPSSGMSSADRTIGPDDPVLITGSTGFIGRTLVRRLLDRGFRRIRCFARHTSDTSTLDTVAGGNRNGARIEIVRGNLLSRGDCTAAARDAAVIFHLAMSRGDKSFPETYRNSVVTTRNLIEASLQHARLQRFVNLSSVAVYTNRQKPRWRVLDESCPIEDRPELRGNAYCFAKVRQDDLVAEYGNRSGLPYVIVRPGRVYGAGATEISGRVGIGTFGLFLHLGGSNAIPLTYIDNCVDAIVLAGLTPGIEGEVFNVVDDDLPSSRRFLRLYKRHVRRFPSVYVPHALSHALCMLWEAHAKWSHNQLPPAFNRRTWHAQWKKTSYSNAKLKSRLGWLPLVPTSEGLARYFESCRKAGPLA
jgi:nucleoside-diphosphate-sugar epimerase